MSPESEWLSGGRFSPSPAYILGICIFPGLHQTYGGELALPHKSPTLSSLNHMVLCTVDATELWDTSQHKEEGWLRS